MKNNIFKRQRIKKIKKVVLLQVWITGERVHPVYSKFERNGTLSTKQIISSTAKSMKLNVETFNSFHKLAY